ncbi:Phenol hydroxylase [Psilocybe cubensis]|uniref:Phenol 2-monooxygenase n=2 Tax=Psilocybe cubensis TaxID=181762 RepID=A0A8H7XV75_PSICU|nr:Phenol hydroxylase [Psilocybe cubensis]KAH9479232.1 Phenol hydroxylase [Psilocybe cubensis]
MAANPIVKESKVDVLIVGAGPAGVMACNALARSGVNVRIIDQRPDKVAAGQADGIQPRTIEVFQSYGLAERLLKEGNQMHMAAFYNPSADGGIELTDRVPDVTATSARYPFEVTLHQGAIESIFLDSMREHGVEISRPVIPTSLTLSEDETLLNDPQAYPVRVELQKILENGEAGETEVVHAKFVIGADGAHSWVRRTLSISMDGEQTDYIWGVVDLNPDTDFPDIRNKTAIHSNNGSCMIIPREDDKVRIYIQLDDKTAHVTQDGRVDRSKLRPGLLLEQVQKTLHPYYIRTPEKYDWWTIYIIGQRVASKFSVKERVFIVGDACHTHSPKAGQGMNASMNDSHNLAWKLVHVLNGWAQMNLLKTYEYERRKYAQDLIDFDRQFAKLFSGKPRTKETEDGVSHEDFLKAFQTFGGFTSGIGICYLPSAITDTTYQSLASKLTVGQRVLPQIFLRAADSRPIEIQDLLPSDARFKLLVFTGDSSNPVQLEEIRAISNKLEVALASLTGGRSVGDAYGIVPISSATKANVRYNDLPKFLWSHWSRVLIDDVDVKGTLGGNGYDSYGIDPTHGAIVVVRPDGYVGTICPLQEMDFLVTYLGGFVGRG